MAEKEPSKKEEEQIIFVDDINDDFEYPVIKEEIKKNEEGSKSPSETIPPKNPAETLIEKKKGGGGEAKEKEGEKEKKEKKPEIIIPKGKSLYEKLTKLYEKDDKADFDSLKQRLGEGERMYRSVNIKQPDGTYEKEIQYLSLINIEPDGKEGWKGDLIVYDKNGVEKERRGNYDFSRVKHREWKKTKREPRDGDIYVTDKGYPIKLNVAKIEENLLLVDADDKKDEWRTRTLDQLRVFRHIYKDAVKSRSEASGDRIKIEGFDDVDKNELKKEHLEKPTEKTKELEPRGIIKDKNYETAKRIILKELPTEIKTKFENPTSGDEAFKEYLQEGKSLPPIEPLTYFRLVANGIRIDKAEKQKISNRVLRGAAKVGIGLGSGFGVGLIGGFLSGFTLAIPGAIVGAGAGTIASIREMGSSNIRVPVENGEDLSFKSIEDYEGWIEEQEEKTRKAKGVVEKPTAETERPKKATGSERESEDISPAESGAMKIAREIVTLLNGATSLCKSYLEEFQGNEQAEIYFQGELESIKYTRNSLKETIENRIKKIENERGDIVEYLNQTKVKIENVFRLKTREYEERANKFRKEKSSKSKEGEDGGEKSSIELPEAEAESKGGARKKTTLTKDDWVKEVQIFDKEAEKRNNWMVSNPEEDPRNLIFTKNGFNEGDSVLFSVVGKERRGVVEKSEEGNFFIREKNAGPYDVHIIFNEGGYIKKV